MGIIYKLYQGVWSALDWLFPPACGGCGTQGSQWCSMCQSQTIPVSEPFCEICGLPQKRPGICVHCREKPPRFSELRSWAMHEGPVRNVLHKMKYRRDISLGQALTVPVTRYVRSLNWQIELLVPVPLGEKRKRERGYNQAALLGLPLSLALGVAYAPAALRRAKETTSQVGLSRDERVANVKDAFKASAKHVDGKVILLLDDVATTGSTLDASAKALLDAGAKLVYAFTLARAMRQSDLLSTNKH